MLPRSPGPLGPEKRATAATTRFGPGQFHTALAGIWAMTL